MFRKEVFKNKDPKRPAVIVQLKTGKQGFYYTNEEPIGYHLRVYVEDGSELLVNPNNLRVIGFVD